MSNRKRSMPLAEVPCLACGDPLPESRAKTRRYCSASCRTTAYNLRVSQRLVSRSSPDDPLLPEWAFSQSGEVPLLTSAKASLKDVVTTLDGLKALLSPWFRLIGDPVDVPFVIRETRRKHQHTLSEMTVWERRSAPLA